LTGNAAENFATPRLASGALFVRDDTVLLVHKTYGNGWDVPGGYVDRGESPAAALEREVREELGLDKTASRLLVHDWAPTGAEGDKILYIFDCGQISADDEAAIRLQGDELDSAEWVKAAALGNYVIPRLEVRLTAAFGAYESGRTLYLEHGKPVRAGITDPGSALRYPCAYQRDAPPGLTWRGVLFREVVLSRGAVTRAAFSPVQSDPRRSAVTPGCYTFLIGSNSAPLSDSGVEFSPSGGKDSTADLDTGFDSRTISAARSRATQPGNRAVNPPGR
jgi:8-oxo-dGTP pyrophosphatase MutT (NUDIX family)